MGLLDLKEGVAGGNTPFKVFLVALERLCGILTTKVAFVAKIRIEKIRLEVIKMNT